MQMWVRIRGMSNAAACGLAFARCCLMVTPPSVDANAKPQAAKTGVREILMNAPVNPLPALAIGRFPLL